MKIIFKIFFIIFIMAFLFLKVPSLSFGVNCSDYGGICVDVILCGSDRGEMYANTDCDKYGQICCVPFAPPDSSNSESGEENGLIIENPLNPISDIWQLIMRLINIAQNIGVFVCVILIVWAGYLYVTSAGNEKKIAQAQKTLIWALVGFGIIIIAGAIPGLIYELLTGKKLENNESSSNYPYANSSFNQSFNSEIYPSSKQLGGMVYNPLTNECYWDPEATSDDVSNCGEGEVI